MQEAIDVWNSNLTAMTHEIALRVYRHALLRENLVHSISQTTDELLAVINYYRGCTNACIEKSTNIIKVLEYLAPVINETREWVVKEKDMVRNNIAISEQYCVQHNISIISLKNEAAKEFEKQKKARADQVLQKVEMTFANSGFGGGPKKDDEEDNNDFWTNLKLRSDKSARSVRFGKMYRDPTTKLWWSRDFSGHGGSSYKVFKEGSKGFEWFFDAAKDGTRILNKHKGPIGLFISYKEVIFRT